MAPVHGGQVTTDKYGSYEVLYLPQETRVYLLDTYGMPVSARGVRGQVTMQMREDGRTSSFPLIYVESENAGIREDFLGAPIDVTRVRDGDMTVTVELTNLPFAPTQRDARFVQTFVLSRPPATVQIVTLTEADRPAVERQEVCPVLGTRLGEMGTPIKLVVNGKPLYLCCKGCIAKVQVNPTKYLAAAPQPQRAPDTTTPPPSPAHAHH
jgi:YHS domain-containing protein